MSDCSRAQAHLNDFLDGALSASQALALNAHLEECDPCREEYSALKATRERLRAVPVPDSEAAKRRVMARFREAVDPRREIGKTPWLSMEGRLVRAGALSIAAAAALLILLVYPRLTSAPGSNYSEAQGFWSYFTWRQPAEQGDEGSPNLVARANGIRLDPAACCRELPSNNDLDEMASLHALQSLAAPDGDADLSRDTLADANSRLPGGGRQR